MDVLFSDDDTGEVVKALRKLAKKTPKAGQEDAVSGERRMVKGYRWIKTSHRVWMFEGPPKSRRFHGNVSVWEDGTAIFSVQGGTISSYSDGRVVESGSGHRSSVRAAKDEVEAIVSMTEKTHGCHDCGEERFPRVSGGKLSCRECGSFNIVCISGTA